MEPLANEREAGDKESRRREKPLQQEGITAMTEKMDRKKWPREN